MTAPNVLVVEDNAADSRLLVELFADAAAEFNIKVVPRLADALVYLDNGGIEVILLDLRLPDSEGVHAFHEVHSRVPTVPIVVVSGVQDEQLALELVRSGAQDYVLKRDRPGLELVRSVKYAIERKRLISERDHLISELQNALDEIQTLSDLLPICASCKNIRDDQGFWTKVEEYMAKHAGVKFTHGICPDCARGLYGEFTS